jgi:hypothetical protein
MMLVAQGHGGDVSRGIGEDEMPFRRATLTRFSRSADLGTTTSKCVRGAVVAASSSIAGCKRTCKGQHRRP